MLLSGEQCRNLIDEADFVSVASDDGALIAVIELVIRLVRRAISRSDQALGIEFP